MMFADNIKPERFLIKGKRFFQISYIKIIVYKFNLSEKKCKEVFRISKLRVREEKEEAGVEKYYKNVKSYCILGEKKL